MSGFTSSIIGNKPSAQQIAALTLTAVLAGACAAQSAEQAVAPYSSSVAGAAAPSHALADARRARSDAEALTPPTVPANLDRQRAMDLLSGPLKTWLDERLARSQSAARAYGVVIGANSSEALTALLELGALWQSFGDKLQSAMVASVPAEFARDEQMKAGYLRAVLDATRRPFDEAYGALQACITRAEHTSSADSASTLAACKERLARLPELVRTPPKEEAAASFGDQSSPKHEAPARPRVAGSQATPCVFAGTLDTSEFELFADAQTRTAVARVWRLDLASLVPPKKETDPIRVTAIWPLQGTYWLEAAALPLVLLAREELVKDHVWLDAGTPLQAFDPNGGTLQAMRPRAWSTGSEPLFTRRVSCAELGLSGSIERSYPSYKQLASFSGLLALSAAPGKTPVANLQLARPTTVAVLGHRGAWHHVAARAIDQQLPFSFDAWTKSAISEDAGQSMIGLLELVNSSHVSTRPIKVLVAPNQSAAGATLAADVWFLAGKPEAGFVPVRVDGLHGPGNGALWIQQSELAKSARALSP